MDDELLTAELKSLLESVRKCIDESKQEYDKFQIALTGTLRLMDGESATLTTLHGSKDNLTSYILQQTTDLKQDSIKRLENLQKLVTTLIGMVSDGDRNS